MSKPLNIIQIGVGFWGWSWVKMALESPYWELVGLVDQKKEALEKACEHYGISPDRAFSTLEEALKVTKPDAALVVVGAEAHAEVTINALKKGLHCLVEKPIALTMKQAKEMVDTAEKTGMKLMVSQNYRFRRAPRTVKRILNEGTIGEVGSVFINFYKDPNLTGFRLEIDEPLITDMAIHHFDQIRSVLGLNAVSATAYSWNTSWSRFRGNPAATVLFEMENGAVVSYTGNWVTQGRVTTWDGDWCIQGDGGEVNWERNEVTFRVKNLLQEVFTKGALETHRKLRADLPELLAEDRSGCLLEFADAVNEDRNPETSGMDNLNTLAMVLGACKSIEQKRTVNLEEVLGS
jgi:predicted dehydrogenase